MSTPAPYRHPGRGPTAADVDNRDRFQALVAQSLSGVRASAEKWRTGMAALVALVTGGLLIKGPSDAFELTTGFRLGLTVLAGGGLAAAVIGLFLALRAAAGEPEVQQMDAMVAKYGSVYGYEVAQAKRAAADLRWAREALVVSLLMLGSALVCWWWADEKAPPPLAQIEIERFAETPGGAVPKPVCGTLKSADNGHIRIQVSGEQYPLAVTWAKVRNLRLRASCSS